MNMKFDLKLLLRKVGISTAKITIPMQDLFQLQFQFNENADIVLEGDCRRIKPSQGRTRSDMESGNKKYSDEVAFVQAFTVLESTSIEGYYEYMTCNDESCMPPEYVEFSLDIDLSDRLGKGFNR